MKGLIFTYALTYGGAVAALLNPFVGLLIYICFAIIKPESMWYWAVPEGNYSRIIAIALLAGWAGRGFGDWRLGRATPIVLSLIGYLLWMALSAALAPEQSVAWTFVEEQSKIVLPFVVGMTVIQSVAQLRMLAWVIVASHGYIGFEMNLSYYEEFNRVYLIGFGGMDNNSIAIALVASTGLAFFLGLHEKNWWLRILALVCSLLMLHTVLFSFSRGGMLALVLTGCLSFWLVPKRPLYVLIFVLVVAAGYRLAGKEVQERFATSMVDRSELDESADSRLRLWADAWDVMQKHPLFGLGPRHWPLEAASYGWKPGKEVHSLWMQLGAEIGFVGLGFLCAFYGLTVLRLWRLARNKVPAPDPWISYLAQGVIASLFGFAVSAQFVSLYGLEVPFYITLIGAGALKLSKNTTHAHPIVESEAFDDEIEHDPVATKHPSPIS
jgi:probable O-glycosylation ligase (exosortase A-associated)